LIIHNELEGTREEVAIAYLKIHSPGGGEDNIEMYGF